MSGFWVWYANLPNYSVHHPVPGLIICCSILLLILVAPVLAYRLAFKVLVTVMALAVTLVCLAAGFATSWLKKSFQNHREVNVVCKESGNTL